MQFVKSVKRLVFDLMKTSFPRRLIGISRLIVEVLNNQNLLQNRIWLIGFRVLSSFVPVVISQNELKLLGSVEKMNDLKAGVGGNNRSTVMKDYIQLYIECLLIIDPKLHLSEIRDYLERDPGLNGPDLPSVMTIQWFIAQ